MNQEIGRGVLTLLFGELVRELSPESLTRIAEKVSAYIHNSELRNKSHVRKMLDILDLEMKADVMKHRGEHGKALRIQIEAEELRLNL